MQQHNANCNSPSFVLPAGKKEFQLFTKKSFVVITPDIDLEEASMGFTWDFLSKVETIIFYKPVKSLAVIIENLMKQGKSLETPIFIVGFGMNKRYLLIKSNAKDIQEVMAKQEVSRIEAIIVGEALRLIEKDKVFFGNILLGKKIIFTRTKSEPRQLLKDLRYLGAEVLELPLFDIEMMGSYAAVDSIFIQPQRYSWLVFTSIVGVEYFIARLLGNKHDIHCLSKTKICALGLETAESLMSFGLDIDFMPSIYCLETCLRELIARGIAQEDILILGNNEENKALSAKIDKVCEKVMEFPMFNIHSARVLTEDQMQQLERFGSADLMIFNHPASVRAMKEVWPQINHFVNEAKIAVVGPLTQKAAQNEGIEIDIMPREVTIPSLIQAIIDYFYNQ